METCEIFNLSNIEQNRMIFVRYMTICNLGVIRLLAPPIYEIFTNLTISTPIKSTCLHSNPKEKIKISHE